VDVEARDIRCNVQLNPGMSCKKSIQQTGPFFHQITLTFKEKLVNHYIWSIAETWTLGKVDQKYLESFAMWCWRRMEVSWTDRVRNKECYKKS